MKTKVLLFLLETIYLKVMDVMQVLPIDHPYPYTSSRRLNGKMLMHTKLDEKCL